MLFDSLSAATDHLLAAYANLSSLAKICDEETFCMILVASVWPLVQLNIPEKFLNPVVDPKPPTKGEEHIKKLHAVLLLKHDAAVLS